MTGDDGGTRKSVNWDIPPWELPGNFRLDAKDHRGPLLRRLANVGFVCSIASLYPIGFFFLICLVETWVNLLAAAIVLGLIGSMFGLTAWLLARRDLEEMRTGETSTVGQEETKFGRDRGVLSFLVGLCSFLLWGVCALFEYLQL
jgi:hypothetical protein